MAHFAKIENGIVQQVIVIGNSDCLDSNGVEREEIGSKFCTDLFGGEWVQTSYHGTFRKNYAGIGYVWDAYRNAFIPPKIFNSWVLNEETCRWEPPVPYPNDGTEYDWNDALATWVPIQ